MGQSLNKIAKFEGTYSSVLLATSYDGIVGLSQAQRRALAPKITNQGGVLEVIQKYDGKNPLHANGNERYINNGQNTVTIRGGPQTTPTENHAPTIAMEAAQLALMSDTQAIYMNRPIHEIIPGVEFDPNIHPDIVRVTTDNRYEITEVRSAKQPFGYLENLLQRAEMQVFQHNAATGQIIDLQWRVIQNPSWRPEDLQRTLASR